MCHICESLDKSNIYGENPILIKELKFALFEYNERLALLEDDDWFNKRFCGMNFPIIFGEPVNESPEEYRSKLILRYSNRVVELTACLVEAQKKNVELFN